MLPISSNVICSTDMYKERSIKSMDRQQRGSSERLIIAGENTRKPADGKLFLANEENKKQLIKTMLHVCSKVTR